MAIPKRHEGLPGTYFVTSRTWESRALFVAEEVCKLFVASLLSYRDANACSLHAFVLMPDHFHLLLTTARDKSLERVVQYVKGGSARVIGLSRQLRFPVWQRGFSDHRVRDASDFLIHLEYIAHNPLKRRLAADPREYPWCSSSGSWRMAPPPQRLKPPGCD